MHDELPEGIISYGSCAALMAKFGNRQIPMSDIDRATDEAWTALREANLETDARHFICRHADRLARLEHNDRGELVPVQLDQNRLRHRLNEIADWTRGEKRAPAVSLDVVRNVLATPDP